VRYVGERVVFRRRLADQEAVAFPLLDDGLRLEAAWLYVVRALERLATGDPAAEAESSLAKGFACEAALEAIDHAIQFHGGRGYAGGLPHEQRWRDVRSGQIAHGPSELLRRLAAHRLWPRPRADNP
jgi:acyl-CoA dehydrogenase